MKKDFAKTLKRLRTLKGMTQQELAEKIFVTRSIIAKWENALNLPDIFMIERICKALEVNEYDLIKVLLKNESTDEFNVIILDDRKIIVRGSLPIIEEVLPDANIFGFTKPSEAVDFAQKNKVSLAFLDIELGAINGIDLSKQFLEINPQTNIIFLTAYIDYSFQAWSTGASGYLLKPITAENLKAQLKNLRFPIPPPLRI